jgi:hypothetical protein
MVYTSIGLPLWEKGYKKWFKTPANLMPAFSILSATMGKCAI